MDNISALSSIASSNAIAGLIAPVSASGSRTTTSALVGFESSVTVDFSQFAQGLLAQQASDPNLSIDAALARNLGDLPLASSSGSGPLYTPSGLLQQFASSQLLAQLESSGTITADDRKLIESLQTSPAESTGTPTLVDATSATVPNEAADQTATTASANTNTTSTAAADVTSTTVDDVEADQSEPAATDVTNQATQGDIADNAANTGAAAQAAPAVNINDQLLVTALDPYQQAALASGVSAFGKELNVFIPAAAEDTNPPPVAAIAALTPVGRVVPRNEEPAEA
ncbi:MAG: hypothetical protein JWL63_953 [Rhodocyclales bacterium]|nr:hypothetical protein [Rhodocyclales bacterium]